MLHCCWTRQSYSLELEQASTEGRISSYRRGIQPPQRKRQYVEKVAAMKQIVSTYHQYEKKSALLPGSTSSEL